MPLYETTYITRQDVSQQEVDKFAETYTKLIEEYKGKVLKVEQWGLRDLAYPINKTSKGYYTLLGIDASDAAMKEFERKVKLNEDILRCLSFRVDEISKDPSAIIAPDTSGDEIVIGGDKKDKKSSEAK